MNIFLIILTPFILVFIAGFIQAVNDRRRFNNSLRGWTIDGYVERKNK